MNLSHALSGAVTGYIELWGQVNDDPAGTTKQASLDLALAWLVWPNLPNLQFDIGTNIGLTSVTPKVQASHEGSWCQASIGASALVLFQTQINCSPM